MSLGSRFIIRSRQLANIRLLVTPRDCRFTSFFTSTVLVTCDKPIDSNLDPHDPPRQDGGSSSSKGNLVDKPKADNALSGSTLSRSRETWRPQHAAPIYDETSPTFFRGWKYRKKGLSSSPHKEDNKAHQSLWGPAIPTITDIGFKDEPPAQLSLSEKLHEQDPAMRYTVARARRGRIHREHKSQFNSRLKDRGTWSYDWRISLLLLKERYQGDLLIQYFFVGPRLRYYQVAVHDIRRPQSWTSLTLRTYLRDLTDSQVTRLMNRILYAKGVTHDSVVENTILELFSEPSLRHALSTEAFEIAIKYLYARNNIKTARVLFHLMDELEMDITVGTFNIILKGLAAQKDLKNFTTVLVVMCNRQVRPNSATWAALLQTVDSKAAKLIIYQQMRRYGMFSNGSSPAVIQAVVSEFISMDLLAHLDSGQDFKDFWGVCEKRYGSKWFSPMIGNKMCTFLVERGLMLKARRLLDIMHDIRCYPDERIMQILLNHTKRSRDPEQALQILRMFSTNWGINPDECCFDTLFMLAWHRRLLNCCKVIWQSSCLKLAVTARVQEVVTNSLIRNTPEQPTIYSEKWNKIAGKVIVGIGLDKVYGSTKPDDSPNIMRNLIGWRKSGDDRAGSLELASLLVRRDFGAIEKYALRRDFLDMFAEAINLDRAWASEKVWDEESTEQATEWALQHAIRIDVEESDSFALRSK